MVEVAPERGLAAAVVVAGDSTGPDDPLQGGAGPVLRFCGAMAAASGCDGVDRIPPGTGGAG
jgi:hypothetical protein